MNITIQTTELGIEYKCDEPFLRGLAHTLDEALERLKKIVTPTALATPPNVES